jgi:hypothetical protein
LDFDLAALHNVQIDGRLTGLKDDLTIGVVAGGTQGRNQRKFCAGKPGKRDFFYLGHSTLLDAAAIILSDSGILCLTAGAGYRPCFALTHNFPNLAGDDVETDAQASRSASTPASGVLPATARKAGDSLTVTFIGTSG